MNFAIVIMNTYYVWPLAFCVFCDLNDIDDELHVYVFFGIQKINHVSL